MDFLHQHFTYDDIEIEFTTDDFSLLNTPSSLDSNSICVSIFIRKQNNILSIYSRSFQKTVSAVHYMNFVKKFMANPSYRRTFLIDGYIHWEGIVYYSPSSIHPQCRVIIEELNKKEIIKFKDLVQLKTFGRDKVSSMNLEGLKATVSKEDYSFILSKSENEHITLSSLRWIARGLKPQHSLYKARVDMEIERNKQASHEVNL